jgi:hypothetical protein
MFCVGGFVTGGRSWSSLPSVAPGMDIDPLHVGALLERALGPTADYAGEQLRLLAEAGVENLKRVVLKAIRKLGDDANVDGQVPPRVLKGILEEAPYFEDELSAEYLGGVLASAKSLVPRDDRGASFVSLVGRLSTYQLRTHYIFYEVAHRLIAGQDFAIEDASARFGLAQIYIPRAVYDSAMEFATEEDPEAILTHSIAGLIREGLIEDSDWGFGAREQLEGTFPLVPFPDESDSIIFVLSPLGMELYLVAQGIRDVRERDFLDPSAVLQIEPPLTIPSGSDSTWHLRIARLEGSSESG